MSSRTNGRLATCARLVTAGGLAVSLMALSACSSSKTHPAAATHAAGGGNSAASGSLDTIKPGTIKVAIEPYAPYTSIQSGKDVGLDADILQAAADKLGLKVVNDVTDFTGMLSGVQTRRVDIAIGGIAWGAARAAKGLFTDPAYYSPTVMAVVKGKHFSTIADLKGANLGTVDGYIWVPAIKAVPGAHVHIYPDANSVFDDLKAGRLDVAFIDPLILIAKQKEDPSASFTAQYLTAPSAADLAAHPDFKAFAPYMVAFYLPTQEPKLAAALNQQIDAMYKDGTLATLVSKYGGSPAQFLKPTADMAKARQGVDRPADWQPPSM
jgi:ABC-type amino acid transport substrate-binding protein